MTVETGPRGAFGERLAYQNVVSSRAKFHYRELQERFVEFISAVTRTGHHPKGPFFYSLNNVPMDEIVDIEMFLPIKRADFRSPEQGLRFHSYFEVFPLLRGIVTGDFQTETERVYARLLATLEANDFTIATPFYHLAQDDDSPSASVFVGYLASNGPAADSGWGAGSNS